MPDAPKPVKPGVVHLLAPLIAATGSRLHAQSKELLVRRKRLRNCISETFCNSHILRISAVGISTVASKDCTDFRCPPDEFTGSQAKKIQATPTLSPVLMSLIWLPAASTRPTTWCPGTIGNCGAACVPQFHPVRMATPHAETFSKFPFTGNRKGSS